MLLAAAQGLAHGQTIPNCGTVGSKSNAIKFDQGTGTAYKGIGMVAPIRAKNGGTTDADVNWSHQASVPRMGAHPAA